MLSTQVMLNAMWRVYVEVCGRIFRRQMKGGTTSAANANTLLVYSGGGGSSGQRCGCCLVFLHADSAAGASRTHTLSRTCT